MDGKEDEMGYIISAVIGSVFSATMFAIGFKFGRRLRKSDQKPHEEPQKSETDERKQREEQWDNLMSYTGRKRRENR